MAVRDPTRRRHRKGMTAAPASRCLTPWFGGPIQLVHDRCCDRRACRVLQDAPTRNGDRGPVGFRVAAAMLATAVLVDRRRPTGSSIRVSGHLSRWSGTAAVILAIALLLCQMPRRLTWPRTLSAILAGVVIVIEVLLLIWRVPRVFSCLASTDSSLARRTSRVCLRWAPVTADDRPFHRDRCRRAGAGVDESHRGMGVHLCLVLAASASGFLLVELAFRMRIRVDSIFQTTAGSVAASTLMLLGLALAAVCARPYRLPLGPLLTTRTWPLAVFCLGVLVFGTLASQIAQRLVLESAAVRPLPR